MCNSSPFFRFLRDLTSDWSCVWNIFAIFTGWRYLAVPNDLGAFQGIPWQAAGKRARTVRRNFNKGLELLAVHFGHSVLDVDTIKPYSKTAVDLYIRILNKRCHSLKIFRSNVYKDVKLCKLLLKAFPRMWLI